MKRQNPLRTFAYREHYGIIYIFAIRIFSTTTTKTIRASKTSQRIFSPLENFPILYYSIKQEGVDTIVFEGERVLAIGCRDTTKNLLKSTIDSRLEPPASLAQAAYGHTSKRRAIPPHVSALSSTFPVGVPTLLGVQRWSTQLVTTETVIVHPGGLRSNTRTVRQS